MRDAVAPSSLPLSVSVSVCLRWTVPGLLLLGDGRRLGRSGRLAGVGWAVSWSLGWVGVSRPVGVGAGCFLSCWGFFSLSGALGVSCSCWGFASPAVLGLAGDALGGVGSCWALIWGAPGLGLGFVKLYKFKG